MTFSDLGLCAPVHQAVKQAGYDQPTPIQQQTIPLVMQGGDVFACAQTGTGKTAAFALPILHKISEQGADRRHPSVVVMAPTRELAAQIGESFVHYGKNVRARFLTVYGGASINTQTRALERGVQVLVATPGRLNDLIERGAVRLDRVHTLVLDEADRMLDMGFLPQIKNVIKHIPTKRQTLMFSATVPQEIKKLADSILHEPTHVAVAPVASTTELISQRRYIVHKEQKRALLLHLLDTDFPGQVLIFTRTKRGADRLTKDIMRAGISVAALHGAKSQGARETALRAFKKGANRVLVATDIASRGIDITQLPFVVNFDLPDSPETYVHRIGRTGRADFSGDAITLQTPDEERDMRQIEKIIKMRVPVVKDHPFASN
jgi:ATP-dependent RNA helicase RhlE